MSGVFFGLQLAIPSPANDPWRQRLRGLVLHHAGDVSPTQMKAMWLVAADLLLETLPKCPLAHWDFVPFGNAEYEDWVSGIEDDKSTKWVQDPAAARAPYVLVSLLFLVVDGSPTANWLGEGCDLPSSTWEERATYEKLIRLVKDLDADDVSACALYLTPGGDHLSFSLQELGQEGYEYLREVT